VPRLAVLALLALLLVAVTPATASPRASAPWATVNICDSVAAPDSMGVRASMTGTGRPRRMYMRFAAQYLGAGGWRPVTGARSPWVYAGLARRRTEQAGWTFAFGKPASGTSFRMRGVVDFQWRAKRRRGSRRRFRWVVVMRRRAVTRGGISGVDGGDPPGTSTTSCLIA
jgi:hypothetical protein